MARQPASGVPTTRLHLYGEEAADDPWPLFREMRELGPIVWHETYQRWMVTTDEMVRTVITDYGRFTVEGTVNVEVFGAGAFSSIDERPLHDALRAVWADSFRVSGVERLREAITRMVEPMIATVAERLQGGETVDVMRLMCRPLPAMVMAMMMGIPEGMAANVVRWSDEMTEGATGARVDADPTAAIQRRDSAQGALAGYVQDQLDWRRREPGDDLTSALAHSAVGKGLSDAQLGENLRQLLFAGNESTAKWLAHILAVLAGKPDLQRELAADRALIPAANDEVLRWQGLVGYVGRRARGPDALAGVAIEAGDELDCLIMSAARDPARYADPDRFDIRRSAQPTLAFGAALHHCLGLHLAKLEAEIVVGRLLDALPPFALAAPVRYTTVPLRGPLSVAITKQA